MVQKASATQNLNENFNKNYYVTPEELQTEYSNCIDAGKVTDKMLKLFTKIAKHFATTFDYTNKCDAEACINYAVSEAWQKWQKYNSEKSDNIFAFYTTMIANDLKLHFKLITKGKSKSIYIETLLSNENN